jgi:beta-glucosidase
LSLLSVDFVYNFSDWTATHTTAPSLKAGLDMEMPFGLWYSPQAIQATLNNGTSQIEDVDNAVVRTLTAMYAIGLFDRRPDVIQVANGMNSEVPEDNVDIMLADEKDLSRGNPKKNVTSAEHNALAREIAAKATVLLKNDGDLLPLTPQTVGSSGCIAVIGDQTIISGGGSGHVEPYYTVSQTQGIQNYLNSHTDLYPSGSVSVASLDGKNITAATELATQCSVAIVIVATTSSEGSDRKTLSLGADQDSLVTAVAGVNKNTVVSVITPGASLLPWADEVKTYIHL